MEFLQKQCISFRVMDWDKLTADDAMGTASLPFPFRTLLLRAPRSGEGFILLEEACKGKPAPFWARVSHFGMPGGRLSGTVEVRVQAFLFGGPASSNGVNAQVVWGEQAVAEE